MGLDIIIPTKGKTNYLFKCLQSIIDHTECDYQIHIADTGSSKEELQEISRFIKKKFSLYENANLYSYNYYNFAKINNSVVTKHCKEDTVLFCNNDIELQGPCIDQLWEMARRANVGTVGCRLLFEDGTIQHAGQIAFTHRPEEWPFDEDKLEVTHRGLRQLTTYAPVEEVMGNTAALMCVDREKFDKVGGFNNKYVECFEDVELNMNILLAGYINIYIDRVHAVHAESVTRTKGAAAMDLLGQDYLNNLYPFWNKLSASQQRTITNFTK
tara:strand:- start:4253 stop:5062 length:810 start_codon:yes stop_codon:yes gene_type:complete